MKEVQLTGKQKQLSDQIQRVGSYKQAQFIKDTYRQESVRDLKKRWKPGLSSGFAYLFTLIPNILGIKEPVPQVNKELIKEYILQMHPNISLEEIYYAFKMDLFGAYGDVTDHYQLFNVQYVGSVIRKYVQWKKNKMIQCNIEAPKEIESKYNEIEKQIIIKKGVESCFRKWQNTRTVEVGYAYVFDYLKEKKILPSFSEKEKGIIRRNAEKAMAQRKEPKYYLEKFKKQVWGNSLGGEMKRQALHLFFSKIQRDNKDISYFL